MKIRRTAWALLIAAVLSPNCRDKQPTQRRSPSPGATAPHTAPREDPPLAKWLRRVPADARWAVVSADLGRLQAVLSDTASLLGHHSQIAPALLRWQARLKRQWGIWPLAPDDWARLKIQRGSGAALYRRADGTTVLVTGKVPLGTVLETVNHAIRQRGERQVGPVKRLQIAGQPAFGMDRWTCATRGKLSWCADVKPAHFAALLGEPTPNLWRETLRPAKGQYLGERLGIWIAPPPGPRKADPSEPGLARSLYRTAQHGLGFAPRGLWLTLSLGRRLQLYGLAFGPQGTSTSRRLPSPGLPKPGQSGLAATVSAPLVVRLRMEPRLLADHLQRLMPSVRPAVKMVRDKRAGGKTVSEEMLNGEVVLLSDHTGVAAILGLRSRPRGLRAMKRLMLMLGPRIGVWQKRVRERGRGWDLSYTRASLGDVSTHRLTLQVPPDAGAGAPKLRDGRMTLLWGVAQRHLLVATEPNLFRRILARVEQPDTGFLRQLGGAVGRRGFEDHHAVAAYMQPDDPLYSLPKAQRNAAHHWLGELAPTSRLWVRWIRALLDLTDNATLSCEDLPVGVGCHLGISLLTKPGPVAKPVKTPGKTPVKTPGKTPGKLTGKKPAKVPLLKLDARYREALIKKWGGNRDGHLDRLRSLARLTDASPQRSKASRILAHRQGVPNGGLEGLLVSIWLPWARHRIAVAARRSAPRELNRLARALMDLAKGAPNQSPAARRRWYRKLGSTRITPGRSCCKGGVRRCVSRPQDWSHPTWRRLGFRLSGSHLNRYQLILEPGSIRRRIVLRALGDLDCNGRSSLLQRVGVINVATGSLEIGPLIRVRSDD